MCVLCVLSASYAESSINPRSVHLPSLQGHMSNGVFRNRCRGKLEWPIPPYLARYAHAYALMLRKSWHKEGKSRAMFFPE